MSNSIAFYDAKRQMTLGQRTLGSQKWRFKKLPSFVGWDSHNYVTMAMDRKKCLHVSGNMHVAPLTYFRGSKPLDIDSVEPVNRMVGDRERRVTYPSFIPGLAANYCSLTAMVRAVTVTIFSTFTMSRTDTWRRLLDEPIMAGNGGMNAYMTEPKK